MVDLGQVLRDVNDIRDQLGREPVSEVACAVPVTEDDPAHRYRSQCCPLAQTIGDGSNVGGAEWWADWTDVFTSEAGGRVHGNLDARGLTGRVTQAMQDFIIWYDSGRMPEYGSVDR